MCQFSSFLPNKILRVTKKEKEKKQQILEIIIFDSIIEFFGER